MGVDADTISNTGPGHGHNRSAQLDVDMNPDPMLDLSHEHHHGQTAVPPEKDDMMFANKGTDTYTGNSNSASPEYKVQQMPSNDEESGGVGEVKDGDDKAGWRKWTFKRVYAKYKILFHFAIWAVWTA